MTVPATRADVLLLPLDVRAVRTHGIGEVAGAIGTVLLRLGAEAVVRGEAVRVHGGSDG